MRTLFLDDNPARRIWASRVFDVARDDYLAIAETAIEAIEWLEWAWCGDDPREWFFDAVYLDHDLGDEVYADSSRPDTGMEVVRWIVANRPTIGKVIVHSMNTPAGNEMVATLRDAGYYAEYVNFLRLVEQHRGVA